MKTDDENGFENVRVDEEPAIVKKSVDGKVVFIKKVKVGEATVSMYAYDPKALWASSLKALDETLEARKERLDILFGGKSDWRKTNFRNYNKKKVA